jgi:hypothetical protein
MGKLQDTIDRVFGDVHHKPASQPLNDAAVRREDAFAEGVRKLEALRAARLAKAQSKPSAARRCVQKADIEK